MPYLPVGQSSQLAVPLESAMVPREQGLHPLDPAEFANWPTAHEIHEVAAAAEYFPEEQVAQVERPPEEA